MAVEITMKELLEAGVHFGHQTRRWNPKMKEYIFGERNGIHIIDLQKTLKLFREAARFVSEHERRTARPFCFVGTKRQAQEAVAEEANRCGMFYVNHRWLGGTLTNWATLQKSIKRLKTLKAMTEDGRMAQLSKKEAARLDRELKHLKQNLSGVENMTTPAGRHVRDRFQRGSDCGARSAPHGRSGGLHRGYQLRSRPGGLGDSRQRRRAARDSIVYVEDFRCGDRRPPGIRADRRLPSRRPPRMPPTGADNVEYVDTSAYESYEKQEGDFVEPGAEGLLETVARA